MSWDPQVSLGNVVTIASVILAVGVAYAKLQRIVEDLKDFRTEVTKSFDKYLRLDLDDSRQKLTDERMERLGDRMKDLEGRQRKS